MSRQQPVLCRSCNAVFPNHNLLLKHVSTVHGSQMPFTCAQCGKGYRSRQGFKLHQLKHEGKTFECPVCHCSKTQWSNVKTHLKQVHKAGYCLYCMSVVPLEHFDAHVSQCRSGNMGNSGLS